MLKEVSLGCLILQKKNNSHQVFSYEPGHYAAKVSVSLEIQCRLRKGQWVKRTGQYANRLCVSQLAYQEDECKTMKQTDQVGMVHGEEVVGPVG